MPGLTPPCPSQEGIATVKSQRSCLISNSGSHLPLNTSRLPHNDSRLRRNNSRLPLNTSRLRRNDSRGPLNTSRRRRKGSCMPLKDACMWRDGSRVPPNDSRLRRNNFPLFQCSALERNQEALPPAPAAEPQSQDALAEPGHQKNRLGPAKFSANLPKWMGFPPAAPAR